MPISGSTAYISEDLNVSGSSTLKGDVTLLLDEGEVRLEPFNVVVQRGTNHAWVNNGKEPALLIAVLIDSELKE